MKISLIIPIYNVESYIEFCLDSIIDGNKEETFDDIEIIGIDDKSPDNSAYLFSQYIKRNPKKNIRLIQHSENKGLGGARNTGIKNAKGDFLFFLDSDDWLNKGALDYLVSKVKKINPNSIFIFGFEAKKEDKVVWDYIPKNESLTSEKALELFAEGKITPSACNKLFPAVLFKKINFKEHIYYEDLEFTPIAINLSENIEMDSKVLFNYRLEGTSITRQKTKQKHIEDLVFVLRQVNSNLNNSKIFSILFFDRWRYLLGAWDLSNELKSFALLQLDSFFNDKEIDLDIGYGERLITLLKERFNTSSYNVQFEKLKKEVLKKIGDTENSISIVNEVFDHVYVVNLKNEVQKKCTIAKQLIGHGVDFGFWEATNGYLPENSAKYEAYKSRGVGKFEHFHEFEELEKYRGTKFIDSEGALGYILTYISILNDAKKNNYESILILEDDVILGDDFEDRFKLFLSSINKNWKIIQLGASQYGWEDIDEKKSIANKFYTPLEVKTCGSFAIGIHNSIYDELIEVQSFFDAPFDHIPLGSLYKKYADKCFVAFPNICIPDVSTSTIRSGRDQFSHGEKMKWNLTKYPFPLEKASISIVITSDLNLKYIDILSTDLNTVYNIRWFLNTEYGIRPLHQNEYLNNLKANLTSTYVDADFLQLNTDFTLLLTEDLILTEELIYDKIISLLGAKYTNEEPIASLTQKGDILDLSTLKTKGQEPVKGLVSIIIPTYKRNDNLEYAISSIVNQTYDLVEIIVVDDNGLDSPYSSEVLKIIERYKENIKLIPHPVNLNGSAARNTGVIHSTGEFICFLDDDDIYYPAKIEESVRVLNKSKKTLTNAVYCGFKGWNSQTNDLNRYKKGDLSFELLSLDFKSHYLNTNTALYRRSAIEFLNGFDETFVRHQDLEFNLRYFEHFEIDVVNETLVELNHMPSTVSNKLDNNNLFKLKEKFLTRFESSIRKYPLEHQQIIYHENWLEALKSFRDFDSFSSYCNSRENLGSPIAIKNLFISSPSLHVKTKVADDNDEVHIEELKNAENENSLMRHQLKESRVKLSSQSQLGTNLEQKKHEVEKLVKENKWYSDTYDHLPLWFLKIGAIFRRIKVKKRF